MKAAQINGYGGKEVMHTVQDAPKPSLAAGQVLVEVRAASVNPFDWKVRQGLMQEMAALDFPATLGGDFAGVVAETGEGVTGYRKGDEVYGQTNALSGLGSFAEFTPVKSDSLAHKPKSTDFVGAASLPLTGVSACQSLIEHIGLQPGQKILIHGGAGGIGSCAIPIAKHLGAYVATTAKATDADYLQQLGADEVIDYQKQDFTNLLQDFDAVYDTVGGETNRKSYLVLKPGGILVSMLDQPDEHLMKKHHVSAIAQFTKVTTDRLNKLTEFVENGVVKPHVDKTFPLEDAAEAVEYLHRGHHRGKVVIML